MKSVMDRIADKQKKKAVVEVRSGDTVRVHQKVVEGGKERIQVFEGTVIRVSRKNSLSSTFSVRRIASGIGVEKTFLIHSPGILKVEVVKRSKVRRNRLNYMRALRGKSSRLSGVEFDKEAVNAIVDEEAEAEEAKLHEQAEAQHEAEAEQKAEETAKEEAKVKAALSAHDKKSEPDKTSETSK